uniref:Ppd20 n=1 Tax=Enterococcus faecalis TaxID=1351 RepID=A0A0N7DIH7_ENTFL|nr:Ppd20 [Enterococcus faecalis]
MYKNPKIPIILPTFFNRFAFFSVITEKKHKLRWSNNKKVAKKIKNSIHSTANSFHRCSKPATNIVNTKKPRQRPANKVKRTVRHFSINWNSRLSMVHSLL